MDLIVYDSGLNELGVIDEFKSLVWTPRFYEVGSFELRAPMTENNIALLRKNRYLYRPDAEKRSLLNLSMRPHRTANVLLLLRVHFWRDCLTSAPSLTRGILRPCVILSKSILKIYRAIILLAIQVCPLR